MVNDYQAGSLKEELKNADDVSRRTFGLPLNLRRGLRASVVVFATSLLVALIGTPSQRPLEPAVSGDGKEPMKAEREEPPPATPVSPSGKEILTTREIVARSEASVALIKGRFGSGTGFLVGPKTLVTNAHVVRVEMSRDLDIRFPSAPESARGPLKAKILHCNTKRDLAILAVETELPPLKLAASYTLQRGEDVTIIGSPGVPGGPIENAITRGVLSTERTMEGQRFYQLGAAVYPGNSGGPVIDTRGRVIGVIASKPVNADAVTYCIPVEDLLASMKLVGSSPDKVSKAEREHLLEVLYLRVVAAATVYLRGLGVYEEALDAALAMGYPPADAIRLVSEKIGDGIANADSEAAAGIGQDLSEVARDAELPQDVRRDLRDLWVTYKDMKAQFDHPAGSVEAFKQRNLDLRNQFIHVARSLAVNLGLEMSPSN